MRLSIVFASILTVLSAGVSAAPIEVRSSAPAEVALLESFASSVKADLAAAVADPIGYLIPETTSWIGNKLATQTPTAIAAPKSPDPLKTLLAGDGPLIKTLTNSVFYLFIDIKLDSEKVLGTYVPGYTSFAQGLDASTYAMTLALNAKYQGFIKSLADAVGSETELGQALELLGANTFALIFDHISSPDT